MLLKKVWSDHTKTAIVRKKILRHKKFRRHGYCQISEQLNKFPLTRSSFKCLLLVTKKKNCFEKAVLKQFSCCENKLRPQTHVESTGFSDHWLSQSALETFTSVRLLIKFYGRNPQSIKPSVLPFLNSHPHLERLLFCLKDGHGKLPRYFGCKPFLKLLVVSLLLCI